MTAENITPFFDPQKEQRQMNVVAFMSGSGTNVEKILEYQKSLKDEQGESPYRVVAIFSDTYLRKPGEDKGSKAKIIAEAWDKENDDDVKCLFWCDINKWYQGKGYTGKNDKSIPEHLKIKLREEYDEGTRDICLEHFKKRTGKGIDVIVLAGHMSFLTAPILDYVLNANVHPADLRITYTDPVTGKVKRKYTGDNAVRDAIKAGEPTIRSSVHIATAQVDYGPLLMVSEPLHIITSAPYEGLNLNRLTLKQMVDDAPQRLEEVAKYNQDRLKEKGDWVIFPRTLEMMAKGMFGKDGNGKVYHKNNEGVWTPGEIMLG